ncbi:unnamed protein product [Linum trigynum]|uniref:Uncharacterized protein n=1 Tax=Linum trigynum TaxID=586398 RepID=A0AAV2EQN6_9ROSI
MAVRQLSHQWPPRHWPSSPINACALLTVAANVSDGGVFRHFKAAHVTAATPSMACHQPTLYPKSSSSSQSGERFGPTVADMVSSRQLLFRQSNPFSSSPSNQSSLTSHSSHRSTPPTVALVVVSGCSGTSRGEREGEKKEEEKRRTLQSTQTESSSSSASISS